MTTSVKTCFKCNVSKPLSEFYKHSQMADGHLNKCKSCAKLDVVKNRSDNLGYYRDYDKDRYRTNESRRAKIRKWYDEKTKKSPAMSKANWIVSNALRDGKLHKEPCEVCADLKSEAHHCDYLKPLDVMWLCRSHHVQWHHKHGSGKNAEKPSYMVMPTF